MRKLLILVLATTLSLGVLYAYLFYNQETDDLIISLRDNSFLPIKPPSKLDTVGAIYYIEPNLSTVTRLCAPHPHREISENQIHESPSESVFGARTLQGTYVSKLKAKTGQMIGGTSSVNDQRSIKVHYELTKVHIYEIDVDAGKSLFDKLMKRKDCSDMVAKYLDVSGYICQDLKILEASASFKLDSESDTGASLDLETEKALALEVAAVMNVRLTDAEGRFTTGADLQWGIQMARLCISPPRARFPRTFPRNNFDRTLNFVKFNILEPILPAT
jgi:hypothetical protein